MKILDASGMPKTFELPEQNELDYWTRLAVLLDPAAFVLHKGGSFNVTVPDGGVWYALNMWNVRLGSTGPTLWQRRVAKLWDATLLPQGTNLQDNGSNGMLYVCKPELVTSDAKYRDPRGLFFRRLARLKTLPLYATAVTIASGASVVNNASSVAFPADFTNGIITQAFAFDVAWTITGASATDGLVNLSDEISDAHAIRFAESMLFPFVRTAQPYIVVHAGNVDGAGGLSLAGNGGVLYHKLPSDW